MGGGKGICYAVAAGGDTLDVECAGRVEPVPEEKTSRRGAEAIRTCMSAEGVKETGFGGRRARDALHASTHAPPQNRK